MVLAETNSIRCEANTDEEIGGQLNFSLPKCQRVFVCVSVELKVNSKYVTTLSEAATSHLVATGARIWPRGSACPGRRSQDKRQRPRGLS